MAAWRETIAENWMYMLAATLLSVLLWVAVSADAVTQQSIAAELVIYNGDRRYILTDQEPETETVNVLFSGRFGDLMTLTVAQPRIVVAIDSVESPEEEITLDPSDVRGRDSQPLTNVRVLSVHPDRLTLHFEPRVQASVPVAPRVHLDLADGYVLADSIHTRPSLVTVEGPESVVSGIDSVHTVPIVEEQLDEPLELEIPLELPEGSELVELSSPVVRVSLSVEPRAERVFPGIPVAVRGSNLNGDLRVDPPLVDVRMSGPRSTLEAIRPEELSPTVQIEGPVDLGRPLPIVLPAPHPFMRISLEPDSARVVTMNRSR